MPDVSPVLPGRLGNPASSLRTDPRADPRMVAAMEPIGMADLAAPSPVTSDSSMDELLGYAAASEEGFEGLFAMVASVMPPIDGVTSSVEVIRGVSERTEQLGVSKIVVSGESGGGNLTLATTLAAKRDGLLGHIAGVYAQCPYISGAYASPPAALTSLFENDGYFLACDQMGALVKVYDPSGANATNPLAWPYHASVDDLRGLPPHVISTNQLDPLRDEGLAYARKLLEAGVPTTSRTVNGTCHAGDIIFEAAMPDVTAATLRDIAGFAHSV